MIYVTGHTGYLGGRIIEGDSTTQPLDWERLSAAEAETVIHCAAKVPKNEQQAHDDDFDINVDLTYELVQVRPRLIIFPSTRSRDPKSRYVTSKRHCERLLMDCGVPSVVIRFPGLFGPPRTDGLVYNLLRALAEGRPFAPEMPLWQWTGMHVEQAVRILIDAVRQTEPMKQMPDFWLHSASNRAIEETLQWVRSSLSPTPTTKP